MCAIRTLSDTNTSLLFQLEIIDSAEEFSSPKFDIVIRSLLQKNIDYPVIKFDKNIMIID